MAIVQVKATINGSEYALSFNAESGKWEAALTAPAGSSFNKPGGYYGVSVTATDDASNIATIDDTDATLGEDLRLIVVEKIAPVITIAHPGDDAYLTTDMPTIEFRLRDNTIGPGGDSGVDLDTWTMRLDSGDALNSQSPGFNYAKVDGGYDCSYTPPAAWPNGLRRIEMDVKDNDGNTAVTAARSFTIDTVPPELDITSPADNLITNQTSLTVTGTTNDNSDSPVTVTITLGGADQGAVTIDPDTGTFSKIVTLVEGENTIIITATDAAGKTSSVTRTVTLSTTLPSFKSVELAPNPVDGGKTYTIMVEVE